MTIKGGIGGSAGPSAAEAAARAQIRAQQAAAAAAAKAAAAAAAKAVVAAAAKEAAGKAGLAAGASGKVDGFEPTKPKGLALSAGASADAFVEQPPKKLDLGRMTSGYMSTGFEETDRQRSTELTPGDARKEQQLTTEIEDREKAKLNDPLVKGVDDLQVGEKILDADRRGVKAQVPGAKIVSGTLETGWSTTIERTAENEYKVTNANDLGAKVAVGVDVKGVAVGGEGSINGEGKSEYLFKSAEDAKRGADILRNGPRNSDDSKFLEDHQSSSEGIFKVGSAGSATFPTSGKVVLGTNIEAKGEVATAIKYNYKMNDDGTVARDDKGQRIVDSMEFVTKTTGTITGKGVVSVPPAVSVDTGDVTSGQIEIEQKVVIKVPPNVTPEQLAANPSLGTPAGNQNTAETTVKITGESRESGLTEGKSTVRELETKIRSQQADGAAAKPTIETTSRKYEKRGQIYNGGVDIGPVGGTYQHETTKTSKPTETKVNVLSSS